MCLIIYKPNASDTIKSHILDNAERINQDGFGITYLDNFKTHKTMNYTHARKLVTAKRPFVAHYRYTTRGETNRANCHPFTINKSNVLYSNGTVADLGSSTTTDTAIVADYLKTTPRSHWHKMLTMTDVRFAVTNKSATSSITIPHTTTTITAHTTTTRGQTAYATVKLASTLLVANTTGKATIKSLSMALSNPCTVTTNIISTTQLSSVLASP